jgi:hypothetical protein
MKGLAMTETKSQWAKVASQIIKAELAKRSIDYPGLVSKLGEIEVEISVEDLRGRMSRGTFSAVLFIQCLRAIGVKNLPLDDIFFESINELK